MLVVESETGPAEAGIFRSTGPVCLQYRLQNGATRYNNTVEHSAASLFTQEDNRKRSEKEVGVDVGAALRHVEARGQEARASRKEENTQVAELSGKEGERSETPCHIDGLYNIILLRRNRCSSHPKKHVILYE
jgi:hypothetical protein